MEAAWVAKIAASISGFVGKCSDAVLAGFGGAGALAATAIADSLGASSVLIPRLAAVFSAYGINFSDVSQEYRVVLEAPTSASVQSAYLELLERARRDMYAEKAKLSDCQVTATIVRERGRQVDEYALDTQTFNLPCDFKDGDLATLQMRAVKPVQRAKIPTASAVSRHEAKASGSRTVLDANGRRVAVPVYKVEELGPGAFASGPAIIEEAYFTGKVGASWSLEITASNDILLTRNK
jgi:N-methylhydantoinase A/oxoprolinase/acetone carboxylase beta subunit